jgi:hypothetical protein
VRDDANYAEMGRQDLRQALTKTTSQLATWSFALASAKKVYNRSFLEAYAESRARSVSERRMEAEMATAADKGEVIDAEGMVEFHRAIRDEIVTLLATVPDPEDADLALADA